MHETESTITFHLPASRTARERSKKCHRARHRSARLQLPRTRMSVLAVIVAHLLHHHLRATALAPVGQVQEVECARTCMTFKRAAQSAPQRAEYVVHPDSTISFHLAQCRVAGSSMEQTQKIRSRHATDPLSRMAHSTLGHGWTQYAAPSRARRRSFFLH